MPFDRAQYNTCMSPHISGQHPNRKLDFCVGAKLCSGKVKDKDEAIRLCGLPKAPKPAGTKIRRSRKQECPEFDPMTLIPHCENQLKKLMKTGDLPVSADINGICRMILE